MTDRLRRRIAVVKQLFCSMLLFLMLMLTGCGHMDFSPGKAYFANATKSPFLSFTAFTGTVLPAIVAVA